MWNTLIRVEDSKNTAIYDILDTLCSATEGLHKEPNMFHNYETEKITRKARKPAVIAGVTTELHVITAVFLISQ